jgi:hypothetical protein
MTEESSHETADVAPPPPSKTVVTKAPTKTPAFQAMNAERYRRQDFIRAIQNKTGRQMICYVAGLKAEISRDDILFLQDLLHNLERTRDLDFLLHTPGGDMDAAEKLITMVRNHVGNAVLRVVVPDFAKSSGTLMALGADFIVMSDSSELGPIDPQLVLDDGNGNRLSSSIQSYLDAFREQVDALRKDPNDVVAQLMLQKFEPARLKMFQTTKKRARTLAEDQLKLGMFRAPKTGNFTQIASDLLDTNRWLSHGQMIGYAEATELGLAVEYREPGDDLWLSYWQLYCYQRFEVKDKRKLFESSYASLCIEP